MYEFGRGVRIFENIAGVRIRTLVYEKKNSASRFNVLGKSLFNRQIELNTKNPTKQQQSCRLIGFLMFN